MSVPSSFRWLLFFKSILREQQNSIIFSENKLNKLAILHHQRSTVKSEKTECCCGLDLYWSCVFYYGLLLKMNIKYGA